MLPYTEPLQQSAGQQQQLLRQRFEEQHGLLLQQGTSVQQLQQSDAARLQEQQRYDGAQYVLLPRGGDPQQTLQPGGPFSLQQPSHEKHQQQQRSPEDEPWQQRKLSGEQQQPGQTQVNDGHLRVRQQVHQQEIGVEQQLVQEYLAALKSEAREPLLQQVGDFLCRWQQRQQQQQPPEGNPKQSVAPEGLEHQRSQSQTYQQQVQQFLLQHLDRQQLLHASQQPGQQPQLQSLMPQQLPLLQQQQGEGGLHLDTLILKQQSPSRQQPRPQQQQRLEAHRAKKKLRTPSHGSPTPRASAGASPTDAEQQQQQREGLPPPLKKQVSREHQQPARRRQPLQEHEKEVDMKRRITPSSPAAVLLCGSTPKTQDAAAVAVADQAAVAGDVATLAEDAAAAPAVNAAVGAAGSSPQQLQQRKRGVRSSNNSKTSRGMQQRQQQRPQQRPPRQHRQQQQQRQQRQQHRQQVARGSPSPTRGRPGGQRFDFLRSSTYSSTNVPAVAGGETAVGSTERKGSAGGGRPLWSPEGSSGANSCGSTAPGSGVLVQQQTPQRVLQQQQLALLQQHQHPHDQHARHGTYGIVARGVRERLTSRTDADSAATAAAGAGEAGDSSTSSSASTAAGGRRGKHCRTALLQNMRGDRPYVCLSCKYRDPFLTLSPDQLEVTGHKGWSSVLATHCAEKGRWYFEVEILRSETNKLRFQGYSPDAPPPPIHARWRIGWACRYQKYDIPIGCNQFSFALTETSEGLQLVAEGLKRPLPAAGGGGSGSSAEPTHTKDKDIIGCFLELQEPKSWQPDPRKDHKLYEFLQAGILCNPEAPPPLVIDEGAWIEFSVNGRRLGRVFQKEIGSGAYHPSLSLYMGAKLRFNPGPEFAYPPDVSERFQACSGMRRPYIL